MADRYYHDEDNFPPSGPRREPPAVCYECGEDVPDAPFFGDRTCGAAECRDRAAQRRPVAPWLTGVWTR